jgi:hypothetical protein
LRELDTVPEEAAPAVAVVDDADSRFQDFVDAEEPARAPSEGLAKQVEDARRPIRLSSMPPAGG